MSIKTIILLLLLTLPFAYAADWVEVSFRTSWDRKSAGYCQETTQCLVSNSFNETLNNQPNTYWTGTTNSQKPKCINTTQYIGDNYCENGAWSSRTKLLATQLIETTLATSQSNFSLYCDTYQNALNRYNYNTDYGTVTSFIGRFCQQPGNHYITDCFNSICVLKHGNQISFGTPFNTDISGTKSPLNALNLSSTQCDSAKNNDGDYDTCGNGVWYNHDLQTILFSPAITTMPAPTASAKDYLATPYSKITNYVFTNIHDPDIEQKNYTFFNTAPLFKQIYLAKSDYKLVYSFKESNVQRYPPQAPASTGSIPLNYSAWYMSNINLPTKTCDRIIKTYDGRAHCEQQPSQTEYYIVAHKTPPVNQFDTAKSITDIWQNVTSILKVDP